MKIIIEYSKTKREIDGPFSICGSRRDLRRIANRILSHTEKNFAYGWIQIYETNEVVANTSPVPWDKK